MKQATVFVEDDGRITIPPEVGAAVGLRRGDAVIVVAGEPDATRITIQAGPSVTDRTFGVVPQPNRSLAPDEMRRVFATAVTEETMRELAVDESRDRS